MFKLIVQAQFRLALFGNLVTCLKCNRKTQSAITRGNHKFSYADWLVEKIKFGLEGKQYLSYA